MTKEQLQKKLDEQEQVLKLYREHKAFEERFFTALLTIKVEASEKLAEAVEDDDQKEIAKNEAVIELIDKLVYFDEVSAKGDEYNVDTVNYYCWLAQKPKPVCPE